jgi:hypothetical protein
LAPPFGGAFSFQEDKDDNRRHHYFDALADINLRPRHVAF